MGCSVWVALSCVVRQGHRPAVAWRVHLAARWALARRAAPVPPMAGASRPPGRALPSDISPDQWSCENRFRLSGVVSPLERRLFPLSRWVPPALPGYSGPSFTASIAT